MKPPPVCGKCGKVTFASKAKAEEAAYRLQHDHGTRLYAYADHGGWHLTADTLQGKGRAHRG
jgi:hypothetical protein